MKLRFIDFEEEDLDDTGHVYKWGLDEVTAEYPNHRAFAEILIRTNDFGVILNKVGTLVFEGNEIEFVENKSLKKFRESNGKNYSKEQVEIGFVTAADLQKNKITKKSDIVRIRLYGEDRMFIDECWEKIEGKFINFGGPHDIIVVNGKSYRIKRIETHLNNAEPFVIIEVTEEF
jgi:hypothetical protein